MPLSFLGLFLVCFFFGSVFFCVCVSMFCFLGWVKKMYVDTEFSQRKWANIQLDRHNKGRRGGVCVGCLRQRQPRVASCGGCRSKHQVSFNPVAFWPSSVGEQDVNDSSGSRCVAPELIHGGCTQEKND